MSQYSLHVGQFLQNALIPEIEKLNLSLTSMEETGYDNNAIQITRSRLVKLTPLMEFLIEYVEGNEECDWSILSDLITLSGLSNVSNWTTQPIVDITQTSEVNSSGLSEVEFENILIYVDGELFTGEPVDVNSEHTLIVSTNIDVDSIRINNVTYNSNTARIINSILTAGDNEYNILFFKGSSIVYTKNLIIKAI